MPRGTGDITATPGVSQPIWDELVRRYCELSWAVPRGLGLRPDAALEVAHTSWLRLLEQLDEVRDVGVWIAGAARSEATRAARWQTVVSVSTSGDPLMAALDRLPSRSRLLLRVRAVDPEPSEAEVASATGMAVGEVEVAMQQALALLRAGLTSGSGEEVSLQLRELLRSTDCSPSTLRAAARAAFSWRTLDAELAPLVDGTSVDSAFAGARGGPVDRTLEFRSDAVVVHLQIAVSGARRDLLGQLTPHGPASVVVRRPSGSVDLVVDDLGRFGLDGLEAGPASLRVALADGSVVHTEWVLL